MSKITDENGNQQFASGTFTKSDGTTGTFGEFLIKTETSNSIATEWLEETTAQEGFSGDYKISGMVCGVFTTNIKFVNC